MDDFNLNKRKENRLDIYWKIFYGEHLWGYVLDLSHHGIRMILNKEHYPEVESFMIRIRPPKELSVEDIEIEVKRIWDEKEKSDKFYEVGCEFLNLSSENSSKLEQLYKHFEESNWIESLKTELNL